MPTDWRRALAVVAHPDDLEYGASAAIAGWTDEGRSVAYLLATRGEAGIDTMPPDEAGPLRSAEQVEAAAIVGVDVVEFLDHPDGLLEHTVALRRDLAAAIRRHQPELVITINHHPTFPGGGFNMADHRNLGNALLDAVRDAANRWLFPDAGAPWSGVRWVAVAASPQATHSVDVTETLDRGIASLRAHTAYLAALSGPMADADTFLRMVTGADSGSPSVTFELIPM
ncbi:PIG-L deacetylase family protein [Actinokineospora sp. HUAS TT18]|uniref:PIG-L deacetylase family protein n=1 Tax=Actinokineospora sp. HUAS TT18 TaxID=3447451 RepID=UPI003F5284EF